MTVAVGVRVVVGVVVEVLVAVGLAVEVLFAVGVIVGVLVAVGVSVDVLVAVRVLVAVGVFVGVLVTVDVGVGVLVGVGVVTVIWPFWVTQVWGFPVRSLTWQAVNVKAVDPPAIACNDTVASKPLPLGPGGVGPRLNAP